MEKIDGVFNLTKKAKEFAKKDISLSKTANYKKGKEGELRAAEFLTNIGYEVIEVNYNAFNAEIDLICRDGDVYVFVEVKSKSSKKYGMGFEEVSTAKQKKIVNCAKLYMRDNNISSRASARFDIISIDEGKILHIKNAFSDV
jgi:putative endonuclease